MRLRSLASTVSSFALLLTGLAYSTPAAAQAKGFALDRFDPSERGSEWFVLDTLDMRGKVRPAFGVVGDWGYKPLAVYDKANDDKEIGSIVENQFFVHVGGSLALAERIRLGVNLPIAAYQNGDRITSNGRTFTPPESALGDLRLSADLRLFGRYGGPITAALGASVYLPTGDQENYTSDGKIRVQPHVNVAGDIGLFAYAVKAGFNYRPLDDEFVQGKRLGSELFGAVSAGLRLANKKLLIGPELYGSTVVTDEKSFFKKRTTPAEVMLGLHYTAGDFRFGAGVGTGVFAGSRGWGSPQVRGLLNIEWMPAYTEDSDGDGVPDSEDACPTQPGVKTNDPKTNGCPPVVAPADRDGDGIVDSEDACPDVPGVKTNDPKTNGCPADKDGDGVYDRDDACIDVPGVKTNDPKTNGCPPDKDGDGVYDKDDACVDVPGVKTSDPKTNGCPPDRDKDGIVDNLDACPDQPGPSDPDPKKNGCPAARIEAGQIKIIQQVKFKTNSATIVESDAILNAVLAILKEHAEIKKIRVEGHSDNTGKAAYNKTLSQKRAASVAKWLTDHGIDKKRVIAKGWGQEKPIDTNNTEEGRANNRRVEFHIEETPEAPAKAEKAPKAPKKKK
ncbi:OmpA family protein [Pendulispora brunnea]|uniref:OmpA family protein n=1 Tax=Pendulispora brunnea TaxID=2905690 RepID=A0ABZ2K5K6_9BACT